MSGGRLFAVVGPSGAGKDTLIDGARAARPDIHFPRRVITRPETAGGEPFEGVSEAEFARRKAAGTFAIDWQAHGLCYGIPASIDAALAAGRDVVFNGSRAALPAARRRYPGLSVVLVTAPAGVLARRLAARGREAEDEIAARLARADYAVPDGAQVVENGGTVAAGVAAFLACLNAPAAPA
ncbi:phosphonate metabolism protein/1,5-bisphosphokinase (PRPP-forming) PhnN [Rhodovulum sp. YNF3179]|uniref:phosphonate metabolism protein/1,5-bisphosphokinase (PRPP-forming) PhnN n=1 Tax=Rhodovulum sp. YNF3179 TaxID=3425127 RepID=UPI003D3371B0